MGAQQRVYRNRIKSTQSMKKIFSAMELIATSRIARARAKVAASAPYANAITRALSAVATWSDVDHPLLTGKAEVKRAAVLLITSDRGMAGAYSFNVIKAGESLNELLHERSVESVPYVAGRKGVAFFKFRQRKVAHEWTGFSEAPEFEHAKEIADVLVDAFVRGLRGRRGRRDPRRLHPVRQHGHPGARGHPDAAARGGRGRRGARARTS